jgi:signal transduction histidine kinase
MAQTLTALSLDLATLQQTTTRQSGTHKILARMQDLGKQLSLEMQRMVHDLRPAHLDELGLVPALKYLVEHDVAGMKIIVDFRIQGERRRLEPFTETVIYRITQEALTNVARHSRAGSAEVCLCFEPHQFRLTIRDQGVGFDASQLPPLAKRWGLVGMKERAESVHGTLQIQSSPGQGTTIELSIPNYAEEGRNLEHLPLDVGG